jgi:drug/metabolite transporter (DMT)-like permease
VSEAAPTRRSRALVFWSFAAIYIVWGSTYLGIRIIVEAVPPLFASASRFLVAGTVLWIVARVRGAPPPERSLWPRAFVLGGLFFLIGNGGISWAETRVPSGLTALLAATTPLWTVVLESAHDGWRRPPLRTVAGVLLGLAGVAILVAPGGVLGGEHADLLGAIAISVASVGWAAGSVASHRLHLHPDPALGTAMKMLAGGVLLTAAGFVAGEGPRLLASSITPRVIGAWVYLVLFGSLLGFSAFNYLLRVTSPAKVSTSGYVNPLVAVILGWLFLSEPISERTLLAAAVIVGGVVLIRTVNSKQ